MRKSRLVGAHVIVDVQPVWPPQQQSWETAQRYIERLRNHYHNESNRLRSEIKRHVDDLGEISIEFIVESICEFCGAKWTEAKDSPHNGGCCEQDLAIADKAP